MKSSRVSSRESSNRMRESALEEIRDALLRDGVCQRASVDSFFLPTLSFHESNLLASISRSIFGEASFDGES